MYKLLTSALVEPHVQLRVPAALSPGKTPRYTLHKRLVGTKACLEAKKEKNLLPLPEV
jgi:hypothetical protein